MNHHFAACYHGLADALSTRKKAWTRWARLVYEAAGGNKKRTIAVDSESLEIARSYGCIVEVLNVDHRFAPSNEDKFTQQEVGTLNVAFKTATDANIIKELR
jgi:hypothetical protein